MPIAITTLEPFNINSSANFTFASTSITSNVSAGNVKTDNLLYANGTSWSFSGTYSNTNVAAYLPTYTGNLTAGNANISGSLTANSITTSGSSGNITGANYINANYFTGTLVTASQPNITSVGNLTSLTVTGNVSANYFIGDGSQLTGLPASYSNTNVAAYLPTYTGNVSANYFIGDGSQLTGLPASYSNTNVAAYLPTYTGNFTAGNANISGNLIAGNLTTSGSGGNLSGADYVISNYFSGNGSLLTSLTGSNVSGNVSYAITSNYANTANSVSGSNVSGNVTSAVQAHYANIANSVSGSNVSGQVANALIAGTVYTNSQPNITSVGTLTGVTVSGNIDVTGNINVTGNLNYSNVTDLVVGDPLIYLGANNTGNLYDLGFVASYNDGTYYHTGLARDASDGIYKLFDGVVAEPTTVIDFANGTYAQLKTGTITSIGNIISVNANLGNLVVANYFSGNGSLLTSITGSNVSGNVSYAITSNYANTANSVSGSNVTGQVSNALIAGTVYTNAQPNITSVGNLTSLTVTGNVTANYFSGNGSTLTDITGSNVTGYVPNASNANIATTAQTVTTAAQPNITSLGSLSSLTVTGNITSGNASLGNLVVANYLSGADLTIAQIPATYSVSLTGTAYVSVTSGSAMLGSGDYTIEFWIKTTDGDNGLFVSEPPGVSYGIGIFVTSNQLYFQKRYAAQALFDYDFTSILDNAWHHVAFVRQSGTVKLYYDGVFKTSAADSTDYSSVTAAYRIGYSQQTFNYLTGYLSNFRVVNGVAVYTGNFTVPTSKLSTTQSSGSNIAAITTETVLLTFQNSTLVDNSSSARTVTGVNSPTISSSVIPFSGATGTGNITSGNASLGNLTTSNYFSGNGSYLTSITGANVTGYVPLATSANTAGTVTTASQPNITSVGTLTSLSVTGNVTANYFIGNGSTLTDITGSNVTGYVPNASNANTATTAQTVTTAAQPNITSVGSLSALTVTGLITATGTGIKTSNIQDSSGTITITTGYGSVSGDVGVYGNIIAGTSGTGNVTATYFIGNGSQLTGLPSSYSNTNVAAYLPTYTGNLVGLTGEVTTTANITANYFIGNGSQLTGLPASYSNTNVAAYLPTYTGNLVALTGEVTTTANVTANYFIGNGSQLTGISGATITDDTSSNTTYYPVYATANSGSFTTAGITTTKLQFNPSSGQLTVTDLNTLSDATLKTNQEIIEDPFTILNQIFGMGFNWVDSGKKSYGLMAQMLELVLPELVNVNAQGKKTVNYIPIIAFLIEAVKKNQAEIEELKKR